jgi:hypothetical protein
MFKPNVGSADRIMRVILGIVLLAMVFVGPQTPFGWIGLVPLLTGVFGTCPLYSIIGLRGGKGTL